MSHPVYQALERSPIIPAVKHPEDLEQVLSLEQQVVFLLCGDICSIADIIRRLHDAGKKAVVHTDLIGGLGPKEVAADYLLRAGADGIISTRPALIRRGRELGLFTVLRFFVFDSLSLENVLPTAAGARPNVIEILPGIMPKVIARVASSTRFPLICGGLIMDKGDVVEALGAGAVAVSSTSPSIWHLQ